MQYTPALDATELATLHAQWGIAPQIDHALDVDHPFLTGDHQLITSDRRRAEICYVMHGGNPAQGVLLHRKVYYPAGGYRLPTGGIHHGATVMETLVREIYEETGFTVGRNPAQEVIVQRYLGVATYAFHHRTLGATHEFATYHFLVQKPSHLPLDPQDETEQIADWRWLPAAQLGDVAETLRGMGGDADSNDARWSHWGQWRALSHNFVADALAKIGD